MREIWKITCDPSRSPLMIELMGLANHRARMHGQIEEFGQEYNRRQVAIIGKALGEGAQDPFQVPPGAIASILECLARSFAFSESYHLPSHNLARRTIRSLK